MQLNSELATPVAIVAGPTPTDPIPVDATIVGPLPVPVALVTPVPVPVTIPTPVPVESATPLEVTAPSPLDVNATLVSPLPLPVTPTIDGFPNTLHYTSAGAYITQHKVTPNVATQTYIVGVTGFNAHTDMLYVQIHDTAAGTLAGGEAPAIVIPVPGNFVAFSYSLQHLLTNGFLIAISTTPLVFTAPSSTYLSCVVRVQTA